MSFYQSHPSPYESLQSSVLHGTLLMVATKGPTINGITHQRTNHPRSGSLGWSDWAVADEVEKSIFAHVIAP